MRTKEASSWGVSMRPGLVIVCLALLAACQSPLRLNQIQLIGTHNSYKQAIDPGLLEQIALTNPAFAMSIDYEHLPLTDQLVRGVRKFELDVFYDPDGGRYQKPAGLIQIPSASSYDTRSLSEPGFKVLHIQDLDFRSHCLLLRDCLVQLTTWSDKNPRHLPIFITVNAKDGVLALPGAVEPLSYDALAWNQLDAAFRAGLGDKLYSPDEFRRELNSLPEAVSRGWPLLRDMRGRFIVVLDHQGEKLEQYTKGHDALRNRAMFANSPEGTAETAILVVNEPLKDSAKISRLVNSGYIVRTRADANTVEARQGRFDRRDQAFASGAQLVSTDYVEPQDNGYVVQFGSGRLVRCNPLLTNKHCQLTE